MFSFVFMLIVLLLGVPIASSSSKTTRTVTGLYGETIAVPCPYSLPLGEHLELLKWEKYVNDGSVMTLLKHTSDQTEAYVPRVNIGSSSSSFSSSTLLIGRVTPKDQGVYTCQVTSTNGVQRRYLSSVVVLKKPALPLVVDKAESLEEGVLTLVGTCVARDARPAAELVWQKNGRPLVASDKTRFMVLPEEFPSSGGLSTASLTLHYTATNHDTDVRFSCLSSHPLGTAESETFTVPVRQGQTTPGDTKVSDGAEEMAAKEEDDKEEATDLESDLEGTEKDVPDDTSSTGTYEHELISPCVLIGSAVLAAVVAMAGCRICWSRRTPSGSNTPHFQILTAHSSDFHLVLTFEFNPNGPFPLEIEIIFED